MIKTFIIVETYLIKQFIFFQKDHFENKLKDYMWIHLKTLVLPKPLTLPTPKPVYYNPFEVQMCTLLGL